MCGRYVVWLWDAQKGFEDKGDDLEKSRKNSKKPDKRKQVGFFNGSLSD